MTGVGPKPEWRSSFGHIRSWGNSGLASHRVGVAALDPKPSSVEASSCEATEPQLSGRQAYYSMTSSARASSMGGTSRLSALAVFMLMTNSNLAGCSTGKSPALSPLRIRPT